MPLKGLRLNIVWDAQFAGSSSVLAHVEMMGFRGIGNNPMVGATVAVDVVAFPRQWRTGVALQGFRRRFMCATRSNSLRVVQGMWLREGCGGGMVRHWLASDPPFVTFGGSLALVAHHSRQGDCFPKTILFWRQRMPLSQYLVKGITAPSECHGQVFSIPCGLSEEISNFAA